MQQHEKLSGKSDSDLTASELRKKYAFSMGDHRLEEAVERDKSRSLVDGNESEKDSPKSLFNGDIDTKEKLVIDTTLCGGLEFAMTEVEQSYVTQLMTSGDSEKLAQAAHILAGVREISLKGISPSIKAESSGVSKYLKQFANTLSQMDTPGRRRGGYSNAQIKRAGGLTKSEREDLDLQKKLERHRLQNPLPRRMPKYVNLPAEGDPYKNKFIQFGDDEWNGTIADAFSRVHLNRNSMKSSASNNIHSEKEESKTPTPSSRIVVTSIGKVAGREGVQLGDIVTHFNGEKVDGNSDTLVEKIYDCCKDESIQHFSIVFNATASIADILRSRALYI